MGLEAEVAVAPEPVVAPAIDGDGRAFGGLDGVVRRHGPILAGFVRRRRAAAVLADGRQLVGRAGGGRGGGQAGGGVDPDDPALAAAFVEQATAIAEHEWTPSTRSCRCWAMRTR